MQYRFKRCIFQCADKQGVSEISKISIGRKLVRVPLPLFWTRPSTGRFYQVIKGSGHDCEIKDNDIVFPPGTGSENKESVSESVQSTRYNLVRTNTFVRNISFYHSSYSPSTSSVSVQYLQQQQTATRKRSASYMATVTLNAAAKEERAWWIKNPELSNGRAIIQPPLQILMHTDASKKG